MKFQKAESFITTGIDKLSALRKQLILDAETNIIATGNIYYVSNKGNDNSDGRSPQTSWQTLDKVSCADLLPGDTVFFKRGDIFRGSLSAKEGVTYSAYGKGHKPMVFTSPCNGAKFGTWEETDTPDVYRYSEKISEDVGCIIFDIGYAHAIKAAIDFKNNVNVTTGKEFESYKDLQEDLSFYHDLGGANLTNAEGGVLYLKSTMGAPHERFYDIEFGIRKNCINVGKAKNVRINNLCIKYCGCHGISAESTSGLTIDFCEIGWIGGSVHSYSDGKPTRFGNAAAIFGECSDFTVESCYIHDVYDAGISCCFPERNDCGKVMKDISCSKNLIENCSYSVAYSTHTPDQEISHVRIFDNIMRFAGYGFGKQRPEKGTDAHIKSFECENTTKNMEVFGNIFHRSRYMMIDSASDTPHTSLSIRSNMFLQTEHGSFGNLGFGSSDSIPYTNDAIEKQGFKDEGNTYYTL